MEVSNVIAYRNELTNKIDEALKKFEKETECIIMSINIVREYGTIIGTNIETKIP
ncbi:MAG: hypothetical protein PHX78_02750 [bacterium]|nr:hypothetical protein [bacterium]